MIKTTIAREDGIYKCFPDIAQCPDGTLVCVYRECMGHGAYPFSRIICQRSLDGGRTWLPKAVLDECVSDPEYVERNAAWLDSNALDAFHDACKRLSAKSPSKQYMNIAPPQKSICDQLGFDPMQGFYMQINCSRVLCLGDGELLLVADYYVSPHVYPKMWKNLAFHSSDNGVTWEGPIDMRVNGNVPSLNELRDGRIMLGLTDGPETGTPGRECQLVFFSRDRGRSWSEPTSIPYGNLDGKGFCEGSFVELDNGAILGILRDDKLGRGYKTLSKDGGQTWLGPFPTQLIGLEGRPKVGLLRSGEVCVTYRCDIPNEMLAIHVMTQEAALVEGESPMVDRIPLPIEQHHDTSRPWYMRQYYPGRTLILDMDRSVHRDAGYSGWVELPSGEIFVVDYINDDASLAHIRGYRVMRDDIILFPEGDIPWLHPSGQPYATMTREMGKLQYAKNRIARAKK